MTDFSIACLLIAIPLALIAGLLWGWAVGYEAGRRRRDRGRAAQKRRYARARMGLDEDEMVRRSRDERVFAMEPNDAGWPGWSTKGGLDG